MNRGFDTSYGYLGGSEGHYNQHEGNGANALNGTTVQPSNPDKPVDLWVNDAPGQPRPVDLVCVCVVYLARR